MMEPIDRRTLLSAGVTGLCAATLGIGAAPRRQVGKGKPVVVASANGLQTVTKAMDLILAGADPLDAAIEGVAIVEADPNDRSVGYGGLPNEDGVVELDAAVMHGPTANGGAVASLQNIMHPAAVARMVMQRTDHCLLVGEGALRFARMHGFPEVNLLTEESRKIWLHWKETLSDRDDRFPPSDDQVDPVVRQFFGIRETGTIHCSALDTHGNLGCVTTTSGLSFKIPGRVGDSPILGAGLYLDNEFGSAGSTGRGEANLLNCSSLRIVEALRAGKAPQDAALEACKQIARTNLNPKLRDDQGRPNFDVTFYCVRKDGSFGGASIWSGARMAVHDGDSARLVDCAALYDR
ncbi:N(4)-(beta-N-acetylglucosaminyl)-L-asparaginase [Tautonia marina]|uniref:N(4)-(beta-N-acetylglucosaminyl)-L-asparaginase n=1 Tax=Tautonia marina TaxID=2653855 RepID=UPI0012609DFE|nr:N(4)-(beta-N-acetylglucosaminyl)-L-asparaginase [Tautonia marina]